MNAASPTLPLRAAAKSPALTVRMATPSDGALLGALCEEHAQQVAHERWPFGRNRADALELMEALFETPTRAWAWIAYADGRPHGYAGATAGCSLLERGNYFQIESLYVRAGAQAREAERQLFLRVLRMARMLGCLNLQWRLPVDQVQRVHAQLPVGCVRTASVHYVLPLETNTYLRERSRV
jgi:GNAT superfamily N-acetyltransferase